jgi:hypothetical protein
MQKGSLPDLHARVQGVQFGPTPRDGDRRTEVGRHRIRLRTPLALATSHSTVVLGR